MRLDKLASASALGFIAAGAAATATGGPAGAAVATIAAASAAAIFMYGFYEHYEEKKHAEELHRIEQIYEEYLAKIAIYECNLVTGFPPIFQKNADGTYQAMTMTDAQVNSIARNALRAPSNIELVTYRHHIIAAIAALKKYYFLHADKTGLTVQVILYLLNILEKLLQFEGYAFDIAYLNALSHFICSYASSKGEKSEHFTCLNPVFRHLQYATQKLIHHRETRSQEEMISELRGTCMFYIDRSIRALSKFLIPHTEWHLIDCADPYSLREGIYSAEYITRIIGPARWTHSQQKLPENCSLTDVIGILTQFYLKTIDPLRQPTLPNQTQLKITFIPESVVENIHAIFEARPDKNPVKKLEHPETQQTITTLTQFSKLIHALICFLYFLNELTKIIKILGTAETDNPEQCKRLYTLHQVLSDSIENQSAALLKLFQTINQHNDNQMRIAEKEIFLSELMEMLTEIKVNINTQSDAITERRKAFEKKQEGISVNEKPREHMTEVINHIESACNLTLPTSHTVTPLSIRTNSAQSVRVAVPPPPPPRVIRQPTSIITTHPNTETHTVVPLMPALATQAAIEQQAILFPKTYDYLYENAKTKSAQTNFQLLHLMLDMMDDYTKKDSRALRILHGSFFHNQTKDASQFARNLSTKLSSLTDHTNQTTTPPALVREQLQLLSNIVQQPGVNQSGSFATRVAFIIKKCEENGITMRAEMPRLAL